MSEYQKRLKAAIKTVFNKLNNMTSEELKAEMEKYADDPRIDQLPDWLFDIDEANNSRIKNHY